MSFAKIAAIIAAAAAIAKADREAAMISMEVYMNDIGSHMKDYLSMEKAHPEQSIPPGVLSAYAAKLTDKTDSYTSFFADIGDEQIHYMITGVPWYSTRLAPAISQALEAAGLGEAAPATSSSKAVETTSSKAVETTSSKAVETTSSKAVETSSSKAAETSSSKAAETSSSKAAETTSSKTEESSKTTEATTKVESTTATPDAKTTQTTVDAISQITDGQIQATVEQQTENGAVRAAAGLGAGVIAAAALLL